jgi:hypothetical protein
VSEPKKKLTSEVFDRAAKKHRKAIDTHVHPLNALGEVLLDHEYVIAAVMARFFEDQNRSLVALAGKLRQLERKLDAVVRAAAVLVESKEGK